MKTKKQMTKEELDYYTTKKEFAIFVTILLGFFGMFMIVIAALLWKIIEFYQSF